MHSTKSRFVIGPSNILSEGVYVCTFQPRNFTGWGSREVNRPGFHTVGFQSLAVFKTDLVVEGEKDREAG